MYENFRTTVFFFFFLYPSPPLFPLPPPSVLSTALSSVKISLVFIIRSFSLMCLFMDLNIDI